MLYREEIVRSVPSSPTPEDELFETEKEKKLKEPSFIFFTNTLASPIPRTFASSDFSLLIELIEKKNEDSYIPALTQNFSSLEITKEQEKENPPP